jgi:hypothetical protein
MTGTGKLLGMLVFALFAISAFAALSGTDDRCTDERTVRTLDEATAPVAVIQPMEDMVSNSSFESLNGEDSHDVGSEILNYTWEITKGDVTDVEYGSVIEYRFSEPGLYKIKLIVTDLWDNEGIDFTAVVSVEDLDEDLMPDWWEKEKFGTLEETGSDDYDNDGWTNLQEYVLLMDPSVENPPPPEPGFLEENWEILSIVAAVLVAIAAVMIPLQRKKRKEAEKKKIKYAIEIEKTLDED